MIRRLSLDLKRTAVILVAVALVLLAAGYLLIPGSPSVGSSSAAPAGSSTTEKAAPAPTVTAEPAGGYIVGDYASMSNPIAGEDSATDWWGIGLGLVLKLGLVVGLIYACVWVLKRLMRKGGTLPKGARNLRILETAYLAPERSLHIVAVQDKLLVLGATQAQISFLTELDPVGLPEVSPNPKADHGPESFASLLKRLSDQVRPRRATAISSPASFAASETAGHADFGTASNAALVRAASTALQDPTHPLGAELLDAGAYVRSLTAKIRGSASRN